MIGAAVGWLMGRTLGAIFGALIGRDIELRLRQRSRKRGGARDGFERRGSMLDDDYRVLGANAGESLESVRRRYRELAKRYHPDALRAKGASEAEVAKANEKMGRINAAWTRIKAARG